MSHIVIDARMSGTTTGRYVDKFITNLFKLDHDNSYTLLLKPHRLGAYQNIPSNFSAAECSINEFSIKEQTSLLFQIRSLKPDLVHFPMPQRPLLYRGKTIIGVLDLTPLEFKNPSQNKYIFAIKQLLYGKVLIASALRQAHTVITISNYVKNNLVSRFGTKPAKIVTTYNSADFINELPVEVTELVGKKFIMYVGRHQPHKNLERLIEAHQSLLAKHPDLHLAIVGKPDAVTELLRTKNSELGTKNVVFTGFITDAQLRWAYEHVAAYVFPSLSEGFGLPALEAMAHGAPVVSSSATCLPEVYGDAALYFDPLNIEDMANKIDNMLTNEQVRGEFIEKGYKQANKYSWQRTAEQTLDVYRSALSSK